MRKKTITKLIHSGDFIAEVDVELIYTDDDWSPFLSIDDALKLDDVREALQRGDLDLVKSMARIFKLSPVAV